MENDEHKTGAANRRRRPAENVHATGVASRRSVEDEHATGAARRRPSNDDHSTTAARRPKTGAETTSDNSGANEWPEEFLIEGKTYKNAGILSDTSGEAILLNVTDKGGKRYVLKLYYFDPDHKPDHKVLEKIKKLNGSGLLIDLYSHGVWTNPNDERQTFDYELMAYCEGGAMDNEVLKGDEEAMKKVAVRMGSAIDFLAKHGILHRDIKPGNFFYADKAKTQIVLGDFGISIECPEGGSTTCDDMRTPVYAAPEFYVRVPGYDTRIGVAFDYFALGMALLCLWQGKSRLGGKEVDLVQSKLNEQVVIPNDMSAHLQALVRSLTRTVPAQRGTFETIRKWAKNEPIEGENTEVKSNFKVTFDSSKGMVAHSPAELARMLVADPSLGKDYIYSGRVTRWLEESDRPEMGMAVEKFYTKVYPKNQNAGLMAIGYLLDPAMEYIDPKGNSHSDDIEELGEIITDAMMESEVAKPDSRLKVYLRAIGYDKTVKEVDKFLKGKDLKDWNVVTQAQFLMSFLLNPHQNFPISDIRDRDNMMLRSGNTIEEILDIVQEFGGIDSITEGLIMSPAFTAWLAARNPGLAGKIRRLVDSGNATAYEVLYSLDTQRDYGFNKLDKAFDQTELSRYIAGLINADVTEGIVDGGYASEGIAMQLLDLEGSRFAAFYKSRCSDADKVLGEINDWFYGEDIEERYAPKGVEFTFFKVIAMFNDKPGYYILDGQKLETLDDLQKFPKKELAKHLSRGKEYDVSKDSGPIPALDAWIASFYQENGWVISADQYGFEKETIKYLEELRKIDPKEPSVEKYFSSLASLDKKLKAARMAKAKVSLWQKIFLAINYVLIAIILGGILIYGIPTGNPLAGRMWTVAPVLMIVGFCLGASHDFVSGLICAVVVGFGGYWLLYFLGAILGAVFPWVFFGLVAAWAVGLYFWITAKQGNPIDIPLNLKNPDFNQREMEALHQTFRSGEGSDAVIPAVADSIVEACRYDSRHARKVGILSILITFALFFCWMRLTPQISGDKTWSLAKKEVATAHQWALGDWSVKYTGGSTRIAWTIDSIGPKFRDGKTVFGTMRIAGGAPVPAKGLVHSDNDTIPSSLTFYPVEHETQKQFIDLEYDKSDKESPWHGSYTDRKGIMHQITVTATPVKDGGAKSSEAKKASSKNTKKQTKQAKETEAQAEPQTQAEPAEKPSGNILGDDTLY